MYSRAYIRHLLVTNEPTAGRIITLHNLAWLADLTAQMRSAIAAGTFEELRRKVWGHMGSRRVAGGIRLRPLPNGVWIQSCYYPLVDTESQPDRASVCWLEVIHDGNS